MARSFQWTDETVDLMIYATTSMLPSTKVQDTGCATKYDLRALVRQQYKHKLQRNPQRLHMLAEDLSNLPQLVVALNFPLSEFSPALQASFQSSRSMLNQMGISDGAGEVVLSTIAFDPSQAARPPILAPAAAIVTPLPPPERRAARAIKDGAAGATRIVSENLAAASTAPGGPFHSPIWPRPFACPQSADEISITADEWPLSSPASFSAADHEESKAQFETPVRIAARSPAPTQEQQKGGGGGVLEAR